MREELIAPCGMNCGICIRYLSMRNDFRKNGFKKTYCEGCLPRDKNCLHMGDKCEKLKMGQVRFCFECTDFPCGRLKLLDKRYSTKYHMSMIENLNTIKEHGLKIFLKKEYEKWKCPYCEQMICCHNGLCLNCDIEKLIKNKKYRWGENSI